MRKRSFFSQKYNMNPDVNDSRWSQIGEKIKYTPESTYLNSSPLLKLSYSCPFNLNWNIAISVMGVICLL